MNEEDLIKNVDMEKITREGEKIYDAIKDKYTSDHTGKLLAIDIDTKEAFLGETTAEAVELARKAHPNKVFFVVKIGFSAVEVLAQLMAK